MRNNNRRAVKIGAGTLFSVMVVLFVAACSDRSSDNLVSRNAGSGTGSAAVSIAESGIAQLKAGKYEAASGSFNAALKLSPSSSIVHYLNGMTYHMLSSRGDDSKIPLAEEGLKLSLQFDRSNWLAHYQLGLLHLDQRAYSAAQNSLAEALLYVDDDPNVLYPMVYASYYARDIQTASATLARLREIEPNSQRTLHASTIVSAALNRDDDAKKYLAALKDEFGSDAAPFIDRRVDDWSEFHRLASTDDGRQMLSQRDLDGEAVREAATAVKGGGIGGGDDENSDEMVLVDIVIIRTEENVGTSRGVNLLQGLNIQFGNTNSGSPAYSRSRSRDTVNGVATNTTNLTRLITVPALEYSLNIANASSSRNEILARPSLVGRSGKESQFFAGLEVEAGAASADGDEVYSISKDIGVSLNLTPNVRPNGLIDINVTARRTFLNRPNDNIEFDFLIEVSKTEVTADVIMREGETLILSGLSEKETSNTRDGVPVLQDIPGIQYIFSNRETADFQKSVLILITPRRPNYVYRDDAGSWSRTYGGNDASMRELRAKYSDWFRPYPNTASVFHHMQANSLYREFRTGDVTMDRWENQQSLDDRLRQAAQFLYY